MIRIEKTCEYCRQSFVIEYERNGSGSGGPARRKYCSEKCKKSWYKIPANGNKVEITCAICEGKFYLPPSQAATRTMCSRNCYARYLSIYNRKHSIEERKCQQCFEFYKVNENSQQKYCTPVCFSKSQVDRIKVQCEVCGKEELVKKSYAGRRFCGKVCHRKGQSLGLVKSHTNGRSGYRDDILNSPYFKSSLEADYARFCIYQNINFEYEKRVFEVELQGGKKRYYTPDFYLPSTDEYVELKGVKEGNSKFSKRINSNSSARNALISSGTNITVLYMSDFYAMLKSRQLYDKIPNLENRNYGKTAHLIKAHACSRARGS